MNLLLSDIASVVIGNATKKYHGRYCENKEKSDALYHFCDSISQDKLRSFDISVDENSMDAIVTLEYDDVRFDKDDPAFSESIIQAKSVSFSAGRNGCVVMKVVCGGIWEEQAA